MAAKDTVPPGGTGGGSWDRTRSVVQALDAVGDDEGLRQ